MLNKEVEAEHKEMNDKFNKDFPDHPTANYKTVAVGWLDSSEEYEKGRMSSGFITKLRALWNSGGVIMTLGHHECDFCEGGYGTGERAKSSCQKILYDHTNKVKYIIPEMIFHYMEEHGFKPSDEFIEFVGRTL